MSVKSLSETVAIKLKWWSVFLLLLAMTASGCSKSPKIIPPPPPTRIIINLQASSDLNPDATGRPSPVIFRLYELKNSSIFTSADFFKLYRQDSVVLAADQVNYQQLLIKPTQTLRLERTLEAETRHLGLLAAYRDLDHAIWRTILAVPLHQTSLVQITLGRLTITASIGH